jgi:predicted metal-dependent hydrolase
MSERTPEPPRLLPDVPLPPYTYVPGQTPHPRSDPAGHLYDQAPEQPAPLDPERWWESTAYLHGVDLFNFGFFWEAHETWEGLWHAAGRRGTTADFLKGLIKLAAAGVKLRAGVPEGVRSHARRAAALFGQLAVMLGGTEKRYLGVQLAELLAIARKLEEPARAADAEECVFDRVGSAKQNLPPIAPVRIVN